MADPGRPDDGPSLEMPSFGSLRGPVARRPSLGGPTAAALTGLLVGVLGVLLAWLAGLGCDVVRGTSSCGGAVGFPLLLAAVAVMACAGALLLRSFAVDDAGSTSLLAVGVLAVLVMVFLLDSLDESWALVAVPLASVAAYVASWWLTNAVAGEDAEDDAPAPRDVPLRAGSSGSS